MYRTGHYGVSLLVYAPVGAALVVLDGVETAVLLGAAVLLLTPVPDYDQRVPGITHRGVTHTVLFAALVAAALGGGVVAAGRPDLAPAGVAAGLLGIGGHILGDVLTPAGVRPFWPLSDAEYTVSLTTADSRVWNTVLLGLGVGVTVLTALGLRALGYLPVAGG